MPKNLTEIYILAGSAIFCIVLSIILHFALINKSKKVREIPLLIITILLVTSEIIKQVLDIIRGYDPFSVPLHFCSLFIYLFPLAYFTKGKAKDIFQSLASIFSFFVGTILVIFPPLIVNHSASNIFYDYWTFHRVFFHYLVLLYGLLSLTLDIYVPSKKDDYSNVLLAVTIYWAIAIPMAYLTNINFNNVLKSGFPPLERWHQEVGDTSYLAFIIVGFNALLLVFTKIYHDVYKKIHKPETAQIA
ncbi:MAG: hypothetical protein ACOX28_01410 [Bacilli bacterium]|jgi:hypothetical protein